MLYTGGEMVAESKEAPPEATLVQSISINEAPADQDEEEDMDIEIVVGRGSVIEGLFPICHAYVE